VAATRPLPLVSLMETLVLLGQLLIPVARAPAPAHSTTDNEALGMTLAGAQPISLQVSGSTTGFNDLVSAGGLGSGSATGGLGSGSAPGILKHLATLLMQMVQLLAHSQDMVLVPMNMKALQDP
jgi:hypothetical protein